MFDLVGRAAEVSFLSFGGMLWRFTQGCWAAPVDGIENEATGRDWVIELLGSGDEWVL